jgi:hypothetical protein
MPAAWGRREEGNDMTEDTNATTPAAADAATTAAITAAVTSAVTEARIKASTWDRTSKTNWFVGYDGWKLLGTKIASTPDRPAHWALFLRDDDNEAIGRALPPTHTGLRPFWKVASNWFTDTTRQEREAAYAAAITDEPETEQPAQPAAVVNPPEDTDEHVAGPAAVVNPPAEDEQAEPTTETALPLDVVAEPDESTPVTEDDVVQPPAEDATYPRFEVKREGKLALVIDTENGDKIVFRHRAVKAAQNKADKLEAAAAAAATEPVEPTE